jgi:DNA repair protein RadC
MQLSYLPKAQDARPSASRRARAPERKLREALASYLDLPVLRRLAATPGADLRQALVSGDTAPPDEVHALLEALSVLLRPSERERIRGPADVAALLMAEMGYLQQEQLRVVCLDSKNRLQTVHMVYQGSLNTSLIRIGEIFKEPLRLNSAAVIICHNHPSGQSDPASPEDVLVTREIVAAGKLLDVDVLDHIILGHGNWLSLRERKLGFTT